MRSLGAVVNICDAWRHAKTPSSPSIPSFFWGPDHLKRSLAKSLPAVHDLHLPSFSVKRILLLETNCTHVIGRSFIIGNYWIAKARVCCTLPIICPGSSLTKGGSCKHSHFHTFTSSFHFHSFAFTLSLQTFTFTYWGWHLQTYTLSHFCLHTFTSNFHFHLCFQTFASNFHFHLLRVAFANIHTFTWNFHFYTFTCFHTFAFTLPIICPGSSLTEGGICKHSHFHTFASNFHFHNTEGGICKNSHFHFKLSLSHFCFKLSLTKGGIFKHTLLIKKKRLYCSK